MKKTITIALISLIPLQLSAMDMDKKEKKEVLMYQSGKYPKDEKQLDQKKAKLGDPIRGQHGESVKPEDEAAKRRKAYEQFEKEVQERKIKVKLSSSMSEEFEKWYYGKK